MKKRSKLLEVIRDRVSRGLLVQYTEDDKFTDPTIELTEMDAEAMRIFLMKYKLVPKYKRWLFSEGKTYLIEENDLNTVIKINEEHTEKINQFFRRLLPYNFPEMHKLLSTRIPDSKVVVDIRS